MNSAMRRASAASSSSRISGPTRSASGGVEADAAEGLAQQRLQEAQFGKGRQCSRR